MLSASMVGWSPKKLDTGVAPTESPAVTKMEPSLASARYRSSQGFKYAAPLIGKLAFDVPLPLTLSAVSASGTIRP